jgi:hypothetical protein
LKDIEALHGFVSAAHKIHNNFFMRIEIVYAKSGSCCIRKLD